MEAYFYQFRDTNKLYLLPVKSQDLLIKILRYISYLLFGLSLFVILWLFLFMSSKNPDEINCRTIKNAYYPQLDFESSPYNANPKFHDLVKKDGSYLNQKLKCSNTGLDSWSCLEVYTHNLTFNGKTSLVKDKMNYFDLTGYLADQHAKAFQNNLILSCMRHFKVIDKLFVCIFEITCKYKLFAVLHFVLMEALINWFIMSTLKKDFILGRNGFINFPNNLSHNHKILAILKYCQSVLILINGVCYLFFGILPLCLPIAYFIINDLQLDRFYVEVANFIIISLKYVLFVLKSTKFFVNE